MLGLCAMMDSRYMVRSNRECGEGRYDIALIPKEKALPGILIELKAAGKNNRIDLKTLAETGLSQIRDKAYETDMRSQGISEICRYGVAFRGKNVEIAAE